MEPRRRFRFLREIAQGGFGKVYLAEMVTGDGFSSVVAIKLLHGRWLDNDEIVMRSRDEARLLGRIRHRNIVRVEDLTAISGQCAIVMEYLEGVDLKTTATWLREHNLPFPRKSIFETIGAMAAALDAAYNHSPLQGGAPLRVIHRDIKPSNAMLTAEGEVKVLDFGTARANFEDREAKTQALAFGSQAYMAPERMLAEPDAPAGDIFSLGVTLYELLTLKAFGKIYLREEKYDATLEQRLTEVDELGHPVVNMSPLSEDVRREAHDFLRAMLAYEPTQRPSASDVIDKMELLAEHARDAGIKRFARERVREIMASNQVETDPNDPLTGAVVVEDSSSFGTPPPDGTGPRPKPAVVEEPEDDVFKAPPELVEPPPIPPSLTTSGRSIAARFEATRQETSAPKSISSARANRPAEIPPEAALPPTPPENLRANPTVRTSLDLPPPREEPIKRPEHRSEEPKFAPRVDPPPRAEQRTVFVPMPAEAPRPEPAKGGMGGKILGVLVGVGVVLTLMVGGGYFALSRMQGGTPPPETPPVPVPVKSALPTGSPAPDWSAVAAGKAAVVLTVPDVVTGVELSSVTGLKKEWDGSGYFNLRDLSPGTLRSKVTPKGGGSALRAEFKAEEGKTCLYTFRSTEWEKTECR